MINHLISQLNKAEAKSNELRVSLLSSISPVAIKVKVILQLIRDVLDFIRYKVGEIDISDQTIKSNAKKAQILYIIHRNNTNTDETTYSDKFLEAMCEMVEHTRRTLTPGELYKDGRDSQSS